MQMKENREIISRLTSCNSRQNEKGKEKKAGGFELSRLIESRSFDRIRATNERILCGFAELGFSRGIVVDYHKPRNRFQRELPRNESKIQHLVKSFSTLYFVLRRFCSFFFFFQRPEKNNLPTHVIVLELSIDHRFLYSTSMLRTFLTSDDVSSTIQPHRFRERSDFRSEIDYTIYVDVNSAWSLSTRNRKRKAFDFATRKRFYANNRTAFVDLASPFHTCPVS